MNLYHQTVARWTATISILAVVTGCSSPLKLPLTSSSTEASPTRKVSLNPDSKSSKLSIPKTTNNLGEAVSIKAKNINIKFLVKGIREHPGKRVLKPNTGNKWVLVNTTIVNQGDKASLIPVVAFQMIDSASNKHEVELLAGALEDVKSPTGEIQPGGEKHGEVAFEIPEKARGSKLIFNPNISECKALDSEKLKASSNLHCEPVVVNLES